MLTDNAGKNKDCNVEIKTAPYHQRNIKVCHNVLNKTNKEKEKGTGKR